MSISTILPRIQSFFSINDTDSEKPINQNIPLQERQNIIAHAHADSALSEETVEIYERALHHTYKECELSASIKKLEKQAMFLCEVLPIELWIKIVDSLPLKDIYRFRRVSSEAYKIASSTLPIAPRSTLFINQTDMNRFLAGGMHRNTCHAINILYKLVHNKQAQCGEMQYVKVLLELPEYGRTIENLIFANLFKDEQAEILKNTKLTEAQIKYLTSSNFILELVRGTECNLDAFLKIPDPYLRTGITQALKDSNEVVIENMIASGYFLNLGSIGGYTPLHRAAVIGDMFALSGLIKLGANIEIRDYDGCTALHLAAQGRSSECVQLLLESKANAHSIDYLGKTPLLYAIAYERKQIASALLNVMTQFDHIDIMGRTALHYAVLRYDFDNFLTLLSKKANVNIPNSQGHIPLHYAAMKKLFAFFAPLIEAGAAVNQRDARGLSALHYVAQTGGVLAANLLIQHGAQIDIIDGNGWTPLHYAASNGYEWVIDVLLQHGASPHAVSGEGYTPLHCAAKEGKSESIRRLLRAGASPVQQDYIQNTALSYALLYLHIEASQILLAQRIQSFMKYYVLCSF